MGEDYSGDGAVAWGALLGVGCPLPQVAALYGENLTLLALCWFALWVDVVGTRGGSEASGWRDVAVA